MSTKRKASSRSSDQEQKGRRKRRVGPKGKPRGKPWPKGKSANPATQFQPNQSGNPGGRPSSKEFREKCQDGALDVVAFWKEVATGKKRASSSQIRAGEMIVSHAGYQKATQKIGGDVDSPLNINAAGPVRALLMKLAGEGGEDDPPPAAQEGAPPDGGDPK